MPIFRKSFRTVYDIGTSPDSIITADIIRTRLKKNGAITNINVIVLFYNNRKGFKKALDNSNRFKLNACFILN